MGEQIDIRPASPADAAGIAHVHTRSWQGAYSHVFSAEALRGLDERETQRVEDWRGWLSAEQDRRSTFVAAAGDNVVGFVHGAPARDDDLDPSHVVELLMIYVLPEAWGRGIGRGLMRAFVDWGSYAGFAEAALWVLEDNPQARRFYEAAGWRLDGAGKEDVFLQTPVREVRYRIDLG
jgi:GNAT superfamily N-acetyltransferase